METTLLYLLAAFLVMLVARPLSRLFKLPVLSFYILVGLLLGPSGFGFIRETASLNYFYHLGLVLLMFLAGLELKYPATQKNRRHLLRFFLINGLLSGLFGFLLSFLVDALSGRGNGHLSFNYLLGAIFISSSVGVIIPFFYEFSARSPRKVRAFVSSIIGGTVLADITSLFLVTIAILHYTSRGPRDFLIFIIEILLYLTFLVAFLPEISKRVVVHSLVRRTSVEEQTRWVIVIVLVSVVIAAAFRIHAIAAAFLVGLALANTRIDRRVIGNINFLANGIFIPIFFMVVGAEVNLRQLALGNNWIYPLVITAGLIFIKVLSGGLVARIDRFDLRSSLGFGFATIPQLSATLAAAVAGHEIGLVSDVILDSIIVLSLVTTFLGPVVSKRLLYPDSKRPEDYPTVDDYLISDIHPIHLEEDLGSIMMHVRGQEIPVFPVTDRNGIYAGVVELGNLKELLLGEELKNLVIAQDLVNHNYPFVYRDETLNRVFDRFRENACPALPVLEASESGDYYLGLLLLKDLLPELTIEGGQAVRNRSS